MESEKNIEKIVQRCQIGRRDAFEKLFEIYQPRLKYYIRRLKGNSNNTDDILQDTWLSVFKKINSLRNIKAFNVWLYRIARNKVYDGFKDKPKFIQLPEADLPVSNADEPTFSEDQAR